MKYSVLDCTLRDGAYIVEGKFGRSAIGSIIDRLEAAGIEMIECGWLKNFPHENGSSYFYMPSDLEQYFITQKDPHTMYLAMIDWDRYEVGRLPAYDGTSVDAIRVVFPKAHFKEGIEVGRRVKDKGYQVFFQIANTMEYSEGELLELVHAVNDARPTACSIVDTFGAMYEEDLQRILSVIDSNLDDDILLGFHSHNNMQLSFALSIFFLRQMTKRKRNILIDSSLAGMGRGAGNTPTELLANYMNHRYATRYDMNAILELIDRYINRYQNQYAWGYTAPYFAAGNYGAHVNNIQYLIREHKVLTKDLWEILERVSPEDRRHYDYQLLEHIFKSYKNGRGGAAEYMHLEQEDMA